MPAHGVLLSGWHVAAVSTLVERHVHAARARGVPVDRRLAELLEVLRAYDVAGCATQPAQLSADADAPWWPADDEIDVKEAARLMGTSTQNVRKRAGKSLAAVKIGSRWVLSRSSVLACIASRGVA